MSDTRTYFAKVENRVVTYLRVVTWSFLVANPDRYGDSALYVEYFPDGSRRGFCGIGYTYDAVADVFVAPPTESVTPDETV